MSQLCKVLKFPRSSYYKAQSKVQSKREIEFKKFNQQVKEYYVASKRRYGTGKLHIKLNRDNIPCSLKRVQRHMARQELRSVVVKKYHPYADKNVAVTNKENILNREFTADSINQKWCTDITYIYVVQQGWTYLAYIMDIFTRKIIVYDYGTVMSSELALNAIKNACLKVTSTKGIFLHSDFGSQYTSHVFENYLVTKGILHSFSRRGNPYDNA